MADTATDPGVVPHSALQEALTWLGDPPSADTLRDLPALRAHLVAMASLGIPALQYLKVLELFQARAEATAREVKPLLLDTTLPVPRRLRTVALGVMDVYGALANGYLRVLRDASPERLREISCTPANLCARGIGNLAQQYEIALLVSLPASADFWRCLHTLYSLIPTGLPPDAPSPPEAAEAELGMKAILALAAAQPEGFSPRETAFLADYLRRQAAAVEIRSEHQPSADDYWLDETRGLPPVATARLSPPPHRRPLHFSCTPLGALARRHLSDLGTGDRPQNLGIPATLVLADYRNVLSRAQVRWSNPPKRRSHRRRHGYRVQVCTHLGPLWQQLLHGNAGAGSPPASEWMILNESANGYAIAHVSGDLEGIVSGSAIGLRPADGAPWQICIVRWARSECTDHIELGLELVAPTAQAVRLARGGKEGGQPPVSALLLPPLPAVKRSESLLTARGHFHPGRFTLLIESADRIQIAECLTSQLTLHTASVEIFEFTRTTAP